MYYSKETPSCSTFRVITINFHMSEILGFLWYNWISVFAESSKVVKDAKLFLLTVKTLIRDGHADQDI